MAVTLLFAKITLPKESANWKHLTNSEKPRIRLGYTVRSPSRSACAQAPQKLVVDFGRKDYGNQTSWSRSRGGPSSNSRSPA